MAKASFALTPNSTLSKSCASLRKAPVGLGTVPLDMATNDQEGTEISGGNVDLRQTLHSLLGNMFKCLLLARQKIPECAVVQVPGRV